MSVAEHMLAVTKAGKEGLQMFWLCRLHGANFQTLPGEAVFGAGREESRRDSGIQSHSPETEPAAETGIAWVFPLDLHCFLVHRVPDTSGSSVPSPLTWTGDE